MLSMAKVAAWAAFCVAAMACAAVTTATTASAGEGAAAGDGAKPSTYNWSGLYVGGNAGSARSSSSPTLTTEYTPTGYWNRLSAKAINADGSADLSDRGFTGGVQAGVNLQISRLVIGAEVDFESAKTSDSRDLTAGRPCPVVCGFNLYQDVSTDRLFTARGRVGWAIDRVLLYATGGYARVDWEHNSNFNDFNSFNTIKKYDSFSVSGTRSGWVFGGGVEFGLARNWIARAEYLKLDFGEISSDDLLRRADGSVNIAVNGGATGMFHDVDLTMQIVRVGLSYKFGGQRAAPN